MHGFESKLAESWDPARWGNLTVVVAVSGGPDSVALLRGLRALAGPEQLVVAHYNHRWRAGESDQDQRFVERLAASWGVPCEVAEAAAEFPPGKSSSESAARQARYEFLRQVSDRRGARYVATAHTADDQAETVLHHVIRGSGLPGLAGIPRTRSLSDATTLIRPLLDMRRWEVLRYLEDSGQDWREDATNQDLQYTRNRIRHELIPALARDYNANIVEALLRLGKLAGEAQCTVEQLAGELYERACAERHSAEVALDLRTLRSTTRGLIRETLVVIWKERGWPLRDMSFEKWEQLAALARDDTESGPRQLTLPGCIRAERRASTLRLWRDD